MASDTTSVILCGDPKQLGPVRCLFRGPNLSWGTKSFFPKIIQSKVACHFGLDISLLERLMKLDIYDPSNPTAAGVTVFKLVANFRSHPKILQFPNEEFYDGHLQAFASPETIGALCLPRGWRRMTHHLREPALVALPDRELESLRIVDSHKRRELRDRDGHEVGRNPFRASLGRGVRLRVASVSWEGWWRRERVGSWAEMRENRPLLPKDLRDGETTKGGEREVSAPRPDRTLLFLLGPRLSAPT